ncbi:MAG: M48 family metallopeptidase [Bernardetiaceae bacterium]
MKKHINTPRLLFVVLLLGLFGYACSTVPVTGRRQLQLIPSSQVLSMSYGSYNQFLQQNAVVNGTKEAEAVQKVGVRIQQAVERYMAERGMSDKLKGFDWEFNLVDDNAVNAWCMPGGKVVFYTGILPVCQNETGIAVVMGHEIAHAVAEHGNERMSQQLVAQGLMTIGQVSLALKENPKFTDQLLLQAAGVGAQLGLLSFSRNQESEADEMGLIFMAMAAYDPRKVPEFWERMSALNEGGQAPPQFLSTHPSHGRRISDLNANMEKAMEYYRKSE